MPDGKSERIRDPVHNLIGFDGKDHFEKTMWQVLQTRPMQRLRRIKQLGFSELVFPGATHTRFAHSIGVFHMARQLMEVVRRGVQQNGAAFDTHQAHVALAAALVHDVGHGMFSHAFERFGSTFGLTMAEHEAVSDAFIRDDEIRTAMMPLGKSFADEVADVIKAKQPASVYAAVISSQFDADRLDYIQRDRLMTGVRSSSVDTDWLLSNLEVRTVPAGSDTMKGSEVPTLVFGPKAQLTAESYVVVLLHLYHNVYGHKTTRGAEVTFFVLMAQLMDLQRQGNAARSGLPSNHPLQVFLAAPDQIGAVLSLDDTVFWGALPFLVGAEDSSVARLAARLRDRKLPRAVDIRREVEDRMPPAPRETSEERRKRLAQVSLACKNVQSAIEDRWGQLPIAAQPAVLDTYTRSPYRRFDSGRSPMNQMYIRQGDQICDLSTISAVVAAAEPMEIMRAYDLSDDGSGQRDVQNIIRTELGVATP